jgi:peptidyl-prolyl cis-trans isomerase A (cyclophilin A)
VWARRFLFLAGTVVLSACSDARPAASPLLLTPDSSKVAAAGPDSFVVHFETSRGNFDIKAHRDWAPRGADRFYYLASSGFYDSVKFFRVLDGFLVQFGIHGNPAVTRAWKARTFPDDPPKHPNVRGTVAFASEGVGTRNTQLFINYKNNSYLATEGFAVVGEVVTGMEKVDSLYDGYGEGPPGGIGPNQSRIGEQGNAYLDRFFASLDFVKVARVTGEWRH